MEQKRLLAYPQGGTGTGSVSFNRNGVYSVKGKIGDREQTLKTVDVDSYTGRGDRVVSHSSAPDCSTDVTYEGSGTSSDPYKVASDWELQCIAKNDDTAYYQLTQDVNATKTDQWHSGEGFYPIGGSSSFTGTLDGNGNKINDLYINNDTQAVGLIYSLDGGTVKNVGLVDSNITTSGFSAGSLVYDNTGTIKNSYVKNGVLKSDDASYVDGLVSSNVGGTIDNSYADVTVTVTGSGISGHGGLVGLNYKGGTITNSNSSGSISGDSSVGGLVGYNGGFDSLTSSSGIIKESYSTMSADGDSDVGGLVGRNTQSGSLINESYSTGSVTAGSNGGGLVGSNLDSTINNSVSFSDVGGTGSVFAGFALANNGTIENSFAVGSVSGSVTRGFVADNSNGIVLASYWDEESTGQSTTGGTATGISGDGDGNGRADGMIGDTYNSGFESDIVNSGAYTGFTDEYPVLSALDQTKQLNNR